MILGDYAKAGNELIESINLLISDVSIRSKTIAEFILLLYQLEDVVLRLFYPLNCSMQVFEALLDIHQLSFRIFAYDLFIGADVQTRLDLLQWGNWILF